MAEAKTIERGSGTLAAHTVCVAAGMRDSLRSLQFLVRLMQGGGLAAAGTVSADKAARRVSIIDRLAQLVDRLMTYLVDSWIALVVPDWRKLPSPFAPGMMAEVAEAIRTDSFLSNPRFNAYFYRAAIQILRRFSTPPFLVLEQRVDLARRELAAAGAGRNDGGASHVAFLARTLIALAKAAPVARVGTVRLTAQIPASVDPNISVFTTACVALLFAEDGEPVLDLDEEQFFAVVGALIGARLPRIAAAVTTGSEARVIEELLAVKALY